MTRETSCPCGTPGCERDGGGYYVTVHDPDTRRTAALLGPYATHPEALADVDRGQRLAEKDPRSPFYAYGTVRLRNGATARPIFDMVTGLHTPALNRPPAADSACAPQEPSVEFTS